MVQIEVVFTSNGESADMYVERLTEELKDAGCPNVMVSPSFEVYINRAGVCVTSISKRNNRRSMTRR